MFYKEAKARLQTFIDTE